MDKKRIALIVGFLIITILLGYLLYRIFFATKTVDIGTGTSPSGEAGQFPASGEGSGVIEQGEGGAVTLPTVGTVPGTETNFEENINVVEEDTNVNLLVDATVISPQKDSVGVAKFYNQEDGKFYRLMDDGVVKPLSDQVFYEVQNATWSPTKNESIIEYPDGSNIYYNFDTKKQVTLPQHWQEFTFSNTGDKIASKSMGFSPENRWLVTSDPDGNNATAIEAMGTNAYKVIMDWSPNKQVVALSRTGEILGNDRQEVLLVGLNGENFKSIIVEGRDLKTEWSPSGDKLLHSVYSSRSNFQPELWIVNAQGDSIGTGRKLLNVNTWADKCTFADDRFIYCGVPTSLPNGSGFVPELTNSIPDKLYKIDTQTGLKKEIIMDVPHTIDTLFLDKSGKKIYFTDKSQAGLFNVEL